MSWDIRPTLFMDMFIYVENLMKYIKQKLENYEVNVQKSILFLYARNKNIKKSHYEPTW
jgi:hypothetical protein